MALTEEQLALQLALLTSKTADNTDMTYSSLALKNKALNPDYFTGSNTTIVNAINSAYKKTLTTYDNAQSTLNIVIEKLGSTSLEKDITAWTNLKNIINSMNTSYTTITEGLLDAFQGKAVAELLNVNSGDKGKVLSIDIDVDTGKPIIKTISAGSSGAVTVETIEYTNENHTELTNVKLALDYLLENNTTTLNWNDIQGKPDVPDALNLTDTELELKSGNAVISTVIIVDSNDITEIVDNLV